MGVGAKDMFQNDITTRLGKRGALRVAHYPRESAVHELPEDGGTVRQGFSGQARASVSMPDCREVSNSFGEDIDQRGRSARSMRKHGIPACQQPCQPPGPSGLGCVAQGWLFVLLQVRPRFTGPNHYLHPPPLPHLRFPHHIPLLYIPGSPSPFSPPTRTFASI
ncbi:hypothetical protein DPSP01_000312 [Paraphaeosphaeria sporulosa]